MKSNTFRCHWSYKQEEEGFLLDSPNQALKNGVNWESFTSCNRGSPEAIGKRRRILRIHALTYRMFIRDVGLVKIDT